MRCTATTKQGTPCQNRPMAGHEVCQPHSGGQVGRRSKLTDDLEREILDAVRAGSYLAPAARRAGVSEKTVYEWRRLGREPDAPPSPGSVRARRGEGGGEHSREHSPLDRSRRRPSRAGRARLQAPRPLGQEPAHRCRGARARRGVAARCQPLSDEDYATYKELRRRALGQ